MLSLDQVADGISLAGHSQQLKFRKASLGTQEGGRRGGGGGVLMEYLGHLVLLPCCKVGVLDINGREVVGCVGGQAVVDGCQIMGQFSHGPAITNDVMDGETENIVVATGALQTQVSAVRQCS